MLITLDNAIAQQTALEWFNHGVASTNVSDKINSYEKAIELDSAFVEAYYNLGIAYKSQNRLADAERILRKTYISHAYEMDNDMKIKVIYELGITNKRLGRYNEAKEALLGVVNLTGNSKIRSQIYFEIGRVCMLLEDYDEAIRQFNLGMEQTPENTTYFEDAIKSAQRAKEASTYYASANAHLERGRHKEAVAEFQKVIQIDPNYKDVRTKLRQAQNGETQSQRDQEVERYYRQGITQLRLRDWAAAYESFQNVTAINSNYKDAQARLLEAQYGMETVTRVESIDRRYNDGVAAHKARDWTRAIIAFDHVREMDPNYRDVNRRIREVQNDMDRQGIASTVSRFYNQGLMALNNEDYRTAVSAFRNVIAMDPNYRDVKERLAEAQSALGQTGRQADVARHYTEGVEELAKGEWLNAVIAFEKAKSLDPEFQDVSEKLAEAKAALAKGDIQATQTTSPNKNGPWATFGWILAIIVLPVVGVVLVSPGMRARFYMLQGNYQRAIAIFEKQLTRNPGRVKIYLDLAQAYLLENRKDEKAVQAFEMVLRLNLRTRQKDEIVTIVANHYLREGRTDPEALKLMEKALGSELNKSGSKSST